MRRPRYILFHSLFHPVAYPLTPSLTHTLFHPLSLPSPHLSSSTLSLNTTGIDRGG